MELKKLSWCILLLLTLCLPLAACGGGSSSGDAKTLTFWSAANPPQQAFWTQMATKYMAIHPDIKISVKPIPETPTSEASIQAALAGGTAPTASENIFTGFGSQLQNSQALMPLDQMPGWSDVIKARHMDQTIQSWKFSDGHTYILPMYTNAMLFGWRMDILRKLGYNQPPRTYSQVIEMGQKLKQKFPDKFVWARDALVKDTWYERWFDFFTLYDAASNGQNFISGGKVTADDQAAVNSLSFLNDLSQKKLLLTQTQTDAFETGLSVMDVIGPWRFATWQQKYPNIKLNDTYVLTPPPVPDAMASTQNIKTFADAKGLVIYKQASSDQQNAIWAFIKWVLSDPQHDLAWLQTTSLPSARDDLSTNVMFKPYFDKNPELVEYAANIPNAVPPISVPKYTDIQVSLGDQVVIPVVKGSSTPQQAWSSWKTSVQSTLK